MFITFEGMDGAGKTTQIRLLQERLEKAGERVAVTREPGGNALAEKIRALLLDPESEMDPLTEAYLYAAARAEHVRRVILPALQRGETVLCDRYLDSSLAYQGYGRGLGEETVRRINAQAVAGCLPDRTYLLRVPEEAAARRVGARGQRRVRAQPPRGRNCSSRPWTARRRPSAQNCRRCCEIANTGDRQGLVVALFG